MIKILNYTNNPLTTMGEIAGICYDQTNPKRFANIAKRCLSEGHGRVSEFADITLEIEGYSAKMVRELYTHIIGTSRVQSSTRYIDYSKQFEYITPKLVKENNLAYLAWEDAMQTISKTMDKLKELGIPVEDYTNLLPLAYSTKMVLKINVRALIHFMNVRLCSCSYHEIQKFCRDLKLKLSVLDEEWKFIDENYFVAKCVANGYCDEETRCCGRYVKKSELINE